VCQNHFVAVWSDSLHGGLPKPPHGGLVKCFQRFAIVFSWWFTQTTSWWFGELLDSDKMAKENVPALTRTDEQLVPVKARLPIGKRNLLMHIQKKQKNPIFSSQWAFSKKHQLLQSFHYIS
nr:hypothetical protein [Tanacetum cinerariifolium]